MGDSFKPWRRKIGVVTLLIACVSAAGWVRSLVIMDRIIWTDKGSMSSLTSMNGTFWWFRVAPLSSTNRFVWRSTKTPNSPIDPWVDYDPSWRWNFSGIQFGVGQSNKHPDIGIFICEMPYWFVIFPLTIISACLLLTKPRVAKPQTTIESGLSE